MLNTTNKQRQYGNHENKKDARKKMKRNHLRNMFAHGSQGVGWCKAGIQNSWIRPNTYNELFNSESQHFKVTQMQSLKGFNFQVSDISNTKKFKLTTMPDHVFSNTFEFWVWDFQTHVFQKSFGFRVVCFALLCDSKIKNNGYLGSWTHPLGPEIMKF